MKTPSWKQSVGIAVGEHEVVAVGFVAEKLTWHSVQSRLPGEPLGDCIARLLPRVRYRWLPRPAVVAAVSKQHARLRTLQGIPDNLSARDVQDLVGTNRDRFFVSPFVEAAVTTVQRRSDGEWRAAIVDANISREIFEGCRAAGHQLRAIIPAEACAAVTPGNPVVATSNNEGLCHLQAVGAAHHDLQSGLALVPLEVLAERRAASVGRMRIAAAVCIAAVAVAWFGPTVRDALALRFASARVEAMRASQQGLSAKLDTLADISAALSAVGIEERGAILSLGELADLSTVLPANVVLQQIRIDSAAVEITLLSDEVASVVDSLAKRNPAIQMIGAITDEPAPSELQRVVLRIPELRFSPKHKKKPRSPRGSERT